MTLPQGPTQWKPNEYLLAGECVTCRGLWLRWWNCTITHLVPGCSLACGTRCELLTSLLPVVETNCSCHEETGVGGLWAQGSKALKTAVFNQMCYASNLSLSAARSHLSPQTVYHTFRPSSPFPWGAILCFFLFLSFWAFGGLYFFSCC